MITLTSLMVLAQTTVPAGDDRGPGGLTNLLQSPFVLIILMLVVFYLVLFRGQHREKKKKAQMLEDLKKNDRVMTIGGIIGTIVAIKGDEITVKVDESTNTKMTFIRRAIQNVVTEEQKPDDAKS